MRGEDVIRLYLKINRPPTRNVTWLTPWFSGGKGIASSCMVTRVFDSVRYVTFVKDPGVRFNLHMQVFRYVTYRCSISHTGVRCHMQVFDFTYRVQVFDSVRYHIQSTGVRYVTYRGQGYSDSIQLPQSNHILVNSSFVLATMPFTPWTVEANWASEKRVTKFSLSLN